MHLHINIRILKVKQKSFAKLIDLLWTAVSIRTLPQAKTFHKYRQYSPDIFQSSFLFVLMAIAYLLSLMLASILYSSVNYGQ